MRAAAPHTWHFWVSMLHWDLNALGEHTQFWLGPAWRVAQCRYQVRRQDAHGMLLAQVALMTNPLPREADVDS